MADSIADALLAKLQWAVLEALDDGRWRMHGAAPVWLSARTSELAPDDLPPFLESFLAEAREHWSTGRSEPLRSLMWREVTSDGREWPLQASALVLGGHPRSERRDESAAERRAARRGERGDERGGECDSERHGERHGERQDDPVDELPGERRFVFVEWLDERYAELRAILQRARATTLEFESLHREILKKEVLLHCIVHDLKSPLAGIVGTLSLLKDGENDPARSRLLELALESSRKQEVMIRQVLDVFASELESIQSFTDDPKAAPDLVECVRSVLQVYAPVFQRRSVALVCRAIAARREPLPVVGRADRLERVLANLLENALRYSSSGDAVELEFEDLADYVELRVDDRGPGVPEAIRATLFRKFVQSGPSRGVAGLGLFYCETTVEQWGGAIAYQPRSPRGSSFRLRLAKPARA
ncbi:MAG: HAMP domain-containing histidine kinase [Planctomycetes bacterium]|nr:HAMP domain-containing histidine kinase [Planctomycetota bacterium]